MAKKQTDKKNRNNKVADNVDLSLPQNIVLFGEQNPEDKKIYIAQDVYKEIHRFTKDKTKNESGGVILGNVIEEFGKTHIVIRAFIEAKYCEGTPTTLNAEQLDRVLGTVNANFDMSTCREFTVEAGRPDTIDRERLCALKENKVDRISINPQTLNDSVLQKIGRKHTAAQFLQAFSLAQACGFDNINTDLIAGLPTDTEESFRRSLDTVLDLGASCVTVHTLCMKRAANLTTEGKTLDRAEALTARAMVDYAQQTLTESGYIPYYLYRQTRMVGNQASGSALRLFAARIQLQISLRVHRQI